jgi:hypothetical protein
VQDESGDLGRPPAVPPDHLEGVHGLTYRRKGLCGATDARRISRIEQALEVRCRDASMFASGRGVQGLERAWNVEL